MRIGVRGAARAGDGRGWAVGRGAAFIAVLAALAASPATAVAQSTHLVVVTGLGGAPEYTERFTAWGAGLRQAALETGVPEQNVVWLAERPSLAPGVTGAARVDRLAETLAGLTERAAPDDLVVVALFGHGSARGDETRLNLPGPDLTAARLDALLDPLAPRPVVVVNAASASGGFLPTLSAPGRVVITATRSPGEAEATRFGGHFVAALAGAGADVDKDGRVSFLEAFEFARREVAREFAEGGHLPTEHALLEDDGDGSGSLEPGGGGDADGALAARLALAPASPGRAADAVEVGGVDPALDSLRAEQARHRQALESLRAREETMDPEAYRAELERLLLEIARTGREIRERGSSSGSDSESGPTSDSGSDPGTSSAPAGASGGKAP